MGTIYKLTDGELVYYGSTIQTLHRRLLQHKKKFNDCSSNSLNRDNLTIELVEEVEDKEQLKWRERYYIENNECVNKHRPIQTKEEYKINELKQKKIYYAKNTELLKQKFKDYHAKNRELILQKKKKPYHCECGSVVRCSDKQKHFRSKKHINFIDE